MQIILTEQESEIVTRAIRCYLRTLETVAGSLPVEDTLNLDDQIEQLRFVLERSANDERLKEAI